jgi:hypothetical protein
MSANLKLMFSAILLFIYSIIFIFTGFYILFKRKPTLSKSYLLLIYPLIGLLNFINSIDIINGKIFIVNITAFIIFIIVLFVTVMIFFQKEYVVFDIDEEDFNRIAINTLNSLNMKYEQIAPKSTFQYPGDIKIIDPKYEISISLTPVIGSFNVKLIKGYKNTKDFYKLIKELKKNITNTDGKVDKAKANLCFIFGFLLLIPSTLILFF